MTQVGWEKNVIVVYFNELLYEVFFEHHELTFKCTFLPQRIFNEA
jgi:hypothetical protein